MAIRMREPTLIQSRSPCWRSRSIVFSQTSSRRAAFCFERYFWSVAIARRPYERLPRPALLLALRFALTKTDLAGLHWTRSCSHERSHCSHGPFSAAAVSSRLGSVKDALLAWYQENRRPLPWRETTDPYAIFVSEIMLQQTQVER